MPQEATRLHSQHKINYCTHSIAYQSSIVLIPLVKLTKSVCAYRGLDNLILFRSKKHFRRKFHRLPILCMLDSRYLRGDKKGEREREGEGE